MKGWFYKVKDASSVSIVLPYAVWKEDVNNRSDQRLVAQFQNDSDAYKFCDRKNRFSD